jgi:DNA replication initiation complex subunit (GINS family)
MASESGDMKLLGNFSKLIESVSLNPDYRPANPALPVPALNTRKTASLAAVAEVGTQEAALKGVVNDRQDLFEGVPALITRSGNMLKASGASKKIIDDAKTVARKVTGQRKTPKVKDDPNTPENEATKTHSVSQQSFESIVGNVGDYVAIVGTVPTYTPNETDLTVAGLTALVADLKATTVS